MPAARAGLAAFKWKLSPAGIDEERIGCSPPVPLVTRPEPPTWSAAVDAFPVSVPPGPTRFEQLAPALDGWWEHIIRNHQVRGRGTDDDLRVPVRIGLRTCC